MMQPDAHERWSEVLPLYINGRLDAVEREQLAHHLATCSRCRADLAEWREIALLARQPHANAHHLLSARASLANVHARIAAQDGAPTKGIDMQPSPSPTPAASQSERRRIFPAIAAVAVLAVFVVTGFALFHTHPAGRSSAPNVAATSAKPPTTTPPLAPPTCTIASIVYGNGGTFQATTGQSVTVHNITLTLDQFYTDATRTILMLLVQTPTSKPAPYSAYDGSITPTSGKPISVRYGGGLQGTQGGMRIWKSFVMLPSQAVGPLGAEQSATITVQRMQVEDGSQHLLSGPWQLHVPFTSVSPHSTEDLSCAPQMHQGFSIQVLSVVQAPAPRQADGYPGGITLGVCFAGPNDKGGYTPGFPGFDYAYQSNTFGGLNLAGAIHPPETEAMLTLPDGSQGTPQFYPPPPLSPACRVAGKAGQLYQLTYLLASQAFTGRAIFTVPTIISDTNRFPPVDGPWTFSFDLK